MDMNRLANLTHDGSLQVQGEFEPVFAMKPGLYPATVIGVEGPYPRKADQWRPKGSMRLYFRLKLDGIDKLLQEQGIGPVPEDQMGWYTLRIGVNFPLKDNYPDTYIGTPPNEQPAAWTSDDDEIRKYSRQMTTMVRAGQGSLTMYGALAECGAVDFHADGKEFINFDEVPGARVLAHVKAFDGDPSRTWVADMLGMTAPKRMAELLRADPATNSLSMDQVMHLNTWPKPREGEGDKLSLPTVEMSKWVLSVVQLMTTNKAAMERIKMIIQMAAVACNAEEAKFSKLLGISLHTQVMSSLAEVVASYGEKLPQPNTTEPWGATVLSSYANQADPASSMESDGVV